MADKDPLPVTTNGSTTCDENLNDTKVEENEAENHCIEEEKLNSSSNFENNVEEKSAKEENEAENHSFKEETLKSSSNFENDVDENSTEEENQAKNHSVEEETLNSSSNFENDVDAKSAKEETKAEKHSVEEETLKSPSNFENDVNEGSAKEDEAEKHSVKEEKLSLPSNFVNDVNDSRTKEAVENTGKPIGKKENNNNSSCLNWRTAPREDIFRDKKSLISSYSSKRAQSDRSWNNSRRNTGEHNSGYGRESTDRDRRRRINESNWRDRNEISAELPSNVTDRKCMFHPSESFVKELPLRAGKWMLFGKHNHRKIDEYWEKLKRLCSENEKPGLVALKTSTVADERQGVIRAYTTDFENIEEVKLVGEAILKETGHEEIMFYKTNEASRNGMYRGEGKKSVSLYKLDGSNFYVMDADHKWIQWPSIFF